MKIYTLLTFFVAATFNCVAQNAVTFGDAAPLNQYEVMVAPQWASTQKKSKKSGQDGGPENQFIKPEEINDWIVKYNRNNRTSFVLNYQCVNKLTYVLITSDQRQRELTDAASYKSPNPELLDQPVPTIVFTERLRPDLKRALLEVLVKPDLKCKIPIYPGKNFKPIFQLPANKAFAKALVNDGLANGKNLIQYYADTADEYPSHHYYGGMKDGLPHGYGFFAQMMRTKNEIIVRIGNWENGQFLSEVTAKSFTDSILAKIVPSIDLASILYGFQEIVYEQDVLNPALTNGFSIVFGAAWKKENQPHFIHAAFKSNDFFSYPNMSLFGKDPATVVTYTNYDKPVKEFPFLEKSILNVLMRKLAGYTYEADDYTQITEGSDFDCNPRWLRTETSVNSRYIEGMNSIDSRHVEDRTETQIYGYDRRRTYIIRSRNSRGSSDWITLANFSVTRNENGTGNGGSGVRIDNPWDPTLYGDFGSAKEALNAALAVLRKENPIPVNDPVKKSVSRSKEQQSFDDKLGILKQRITTSSLYRFDSKDSLKGAWYDEANKLIFLIPASPDRNWKALSIDETTINDFDAYHLKLMKMYGVLDEDGVRITWSVDGQIVRKETKVKFFDGLTIRFDDGSIWKRIR